MGCVCLHHPHSQPRLYTAFITLADRSDPHRTRIWWPNNIKLRRQKSIKKSSTLCILIIDQTVHVHDGTKYTTPSTLCRKLIRAYTLNNKRLRRLPSETSAPSSWLRGNRVVMAILTINIHSSPKKSADRKRSHFVYRHVYARTLGQHLSICHLRASAICQETFGLAWSIAWRASPICYSL